MNVAIITGNLGADPDLRQTQGGLSILKLRVATTTRYKDKSGEWKDRTSWINVVVFGKRGESLSRMLSKGSRVGVKGELVSGSYEKDGRKVFTLDVHAEDVELHDRKAERSEPTGTFDAPGEAVDDGSPLPF